MDSSEAQKIRQLDEASTTITAVFPPLWRQLYLGLLEEGFDDRQSLSLVKTYILSQCAGGVNNRSD